MKCATSKRLYMLNDGVDYTEAVIQSYEKILPKEITSWRLKIPLSIARVCMYVFIVYTQCVSIS